LCDIRDTEKGGEKKKEKIKKESLGFGFGFGGLNFNPTNPNPKRIGRDANKNFYIPPLMAKSVSVWGLN